MGLLAYLTFLCYPTLLLTVGLHPGLQAVIWGSILITGSLVPRSRSSQAWTLAGPDSTVRITGCCSRWLDWDSSSSQRRTVTGRTVSCWTFSVIGAGAGAGAATATATATDQIGSRRLKIKKKILLIVENLFVAR